MPYGVYPKGVPLEILFKTSGSMPIKALRKERAYADRRDWLHLELDNREPILPEVDSDGEGDPLNYEDWQDSEGNPLPLDELIRG